MATAPLTRAIDARTDRNLRNRKRLSIKEKIELLRLTKRLLGANGQRWVRGKWFAKRYSADAERTFPVTPSAANCWCLLGAMEEAAYRLGFSEARRKDKRFGDMSSVRKLVELNYGSPSVEQFNDSFATTWDDVKKLLDVRIRQLQKESK